MSLAKKVFLVAGVGSGLGTALVSLLAADGATVVGVARSLKALEPIQAHARTRGWQVAARTANFQDQSEVDRVVRSVLDEFGQIHGVSINVGHWDGGGTLLHQMSDEAWSAGIRENLDPVYRVGRATLPHFMERKGGSLVVVSAAPAVRWSGSSSYCAAKGGLADLVPMLARDYRSYGIRVNGVLPGAMGNQLQGLDPPAAGSPMSLRDSPPNAPWEVARVIRYLLSDESRWVTGSLYQVDGGLSAGGAEPPGA